MQLYSGVTSQFIAKATRNELSLELEEAFNRYLGYRPGTSEVKSWTRSLKELAYRLQSAAIDSAGIVVEYRLPQSGKRLDAMIIGRGEDDADRAVIVELKQWERAYSAGIDESVTFARGDTRSLHLHPSAQAGGYADYLRGSHTAFYSDDHGDFVDLLACSYCHDAHSRSCGDLLAPEFTPITDVWPLFTGDMIDQIEDYLRSAVGYGDGLPGLQRVINSRFIPSRRLLDHVAEMIEGNPVYTLIDEQRIAYDIVRSKVREFDREAGRAAVIVRGGPGTGKSVIAMRLMADLARQHRIVVHATGSKAFTTNLRASVGRRASAAFRYFNSFAGEDPGSIDILVADEAHRIRTTSNSRFTPKAKRSEKSQVEELLDVAKVAVFLLDDNQVVRPGEIGTPDLIRETALASGTELWEVDLRAQFRCSGSDSYLRWLDWLLGVGGDPDLTWRFPVGGGAPDYEFAVVDSPTALESAIRAKANEGQTARLVAGFCWPWSEAKADGSLVEDVVIGGWRRPWNRKERGAEMPQNHPYTIWATQDTGLDEIGCIYSAQGFEFDYCGVIIGPDLVRRGNEWLADKTASYDSVVKRSKEMLREVLNTYRVLLSRGIKGTYVYCTDGETRKFIETALAIEAREG